MNEIFLYALYDYTANQSKNTFRNNVNSDTF